MKTKTNIERALLALAALGLGACGDPLKEAQIIEEPRTLAVQIEAQSGSATPTAGEEATARVVFAGPEGPEEVNLAYRICEAAESARGVPYCAGPVYEEGILDSVASFAEVAFSIPEGTTKGTRFAVLGVACPESAPKLTEDPDDWSCEGPERPLSFSFDAWTRDDEPNQNPDFSELVVAVDGEVVELQTVDTAPTCADGAVRVSQGKMAKVTLDYGPLAREGDEWLQVSHFATGGEYERQFTIIEPDEELSTEIEWKAGSAARPVKHYVVVRDGLGGVGFATFSVCVE